jgi:hypothetical protein
VVGKKVAHALACGLKVILCVGETLAQREASITLNVITDQLAAVRPHVEDWSRIVIAYEPVWAIGTGRVATPAQAQEVHSGIRSWLTAAVSPAVSKHMRIQYGGSVAPSTCIELAQMEDIDGFLCALQLTPQVRCLMRLPLAASAARALKGPTLSLSAMPQQRTTTAAKRELWKLFHSHIFCVGSCVLCS